MDKKFPYNQQAHKQPQLNISNGAKNKPVFVFIYGFIAGLLVFWLFGTFAYTNPSACDEENGEVCMDDMDDKEIVGNDGSTNLEGGKISSNASIVVVEQLAGEQVFFDKVTIDESGWVVVHEENSDGTIGNALGARRLQQAGTYENGDIPLQRNTEPGKRYHLFLYSDDGDGTFTVKVDQKIMIDEMPVVTSFSTIEIDRKN